MVGRRRSGGHGRANNHAVDDVPSSGAPAGVFFCAECGEVLTTRDQFKHHQEAVHGAANLAESESDHEEEEPEAEAAADVPGALVEARSKRQRPRRGDGNSACSVAGAHAAPLDSSRPPTSKGHAAARSDRTAHDTSSAVIGATAAATAAGLHVSDAVTAAKHAVQELWVPKRKPTPGANGAKVTLLRRPAAALDTVNATSDGITAAASLGQSAGSNPSLLSASKQAEAARVAEGSSGDSSGRTEDRSRRRKPKGSKHTTAPNVAAAQNRDIVEPASATASTTAQAAPAVVERSRLPDAATAPAAASRGQRGKGSVSEDGPAARTAPSYLPPAGGSAQTAVVDGAAAAADLQEAQPELPKRHQRVRGRGRVQQTAESATAPAAAAPSAQGPAPDANGYDDTGNSSLRAAGSSSSRTGRGVRGRGRGRGPSAVATAPVKVMWRPKSAAVANLPTSSYADTTPGTGGSGPPASAASSIGSHAPPTTTAAAAVPPAAAVATPVTHAVGSRRYSGRKQSNGPVGPATALDGAVTGPTARPAGVNSLAAGMTGLAIA